MTVIFHDLATRQMEVNAPFTTWTCDNQEILERVSDAIATGNYRSGDAPGSFIITISPVDILTNIVTLEVGQKLVGVYEPRRSTDYSIKQVRAVPNDSQTRLPAVSCEVIAYDIDGVYNIVSVNGSPEEEGTPIHPNTLMRNYYRIGEEQSHGTNLSMEEFVMKLYDSVMYWENKAQLA